MDAAGNSERGKTGFSWLLRALTVAIVAAALVSSLASAPSAQAHGLADQAAPGFPTNWVQTGVFDSSPRFEEFTPSINTLVGVDILLSAINPGSCPADVTVTIRSGSTAGPILGQETLASISPPASDPPEIFHFDFIPGIAVVAGNVHFIEVLASNPCPGLKYISPSDKTFMFQTYAAGPVGGIAELPDVAAAPVEAPVSSGTSAGLLAGIAAITVGAIAVGGVAWHARRRWAR